MWILLSRRYFVDKIQAIGKRGATHTDARAAELKHIRTWFRLAINSVEASLLESRTGLGSNIDKKLRETLIFCQLNRSTSFSDCEGPELVLEVGRSYSLSRKKVEMTVRG